MNETTLQFATSFCHFHVPRLVGCCVCCTASGLCLHFWRELAGSVFAGIFQLEPFSPTCDNYHAFPGLAAKTKKKAHKRKEPFPAPAGYFSDKDGPNLVGWKVRGGWWLHQVTLLNKMCHYEIWLFIPQHISYLILSTLGFHTKCSLVPAKWVSATFVCLYHCRWDTVSLGFRLMSPWLLGTCDWYLLQFFDSLWTTR